MVAPESRKSGARHLRTLRRPQDRRQRRLPLPVRNERGEGWGEGHPTADARASHTKNDPPLPSPLLPRREEREKASALASVVQAALSSVNFEIRRPKPELAPARNRLGFELAKKWRQKYAFPPVSFRLHVFAVFRLSSFGLRVSFGLRISALGFWSANLIARDIWPPPRCRIAREVSRKSGGYNCARYGCSHRGGRRFVCRPSLASGR